MRLLFSPFGRVGRGPFWVCVLLVAAVFVANILFQALWLFTTVPISLTTMDRMRFSAALLVPLIIVLTIVSIKRLHDRGRSGWWLVLMYAGMLGPVPISFLSGYLDEIDALPDLGLVVRPFALLAVLALRLPAMIWFLLELGIFEGEPETNRFGPVPGSRVVDSESGGRG